MRNNILLPAALAEALAAGDEALDRGERGPARELDLLREAGLLRAPLLPAHGGKGWGTTPEGALPLLDVLTLIGGASLPIARIYEGHVNAIRLIVDHGTEDQRGRIATAVDGGAVLGVWGADSEMPVTLAPSGSLAGIKAFASGLGDVSIAVITARHGTGVQMLIADVTDPARFDHASWDVTGMIGSRSGCFDCGALPVDDHNLLGKPDVMFEEPAFHGGIWRLVACYAGALKTLAAALPTLLDNHGIAEDPLMRHRLGVTILEAQGTQLWAHAACLAAERCGASRADVATVLFAREAVEQAALRQIATIERAAGTALHQKSCRAGRITRNLRFYLRQAQLDGKLALATAIWCDAN